MKIKRISLIVTALLMTVFCGLGLAETATDAADAANTAEVQTEPPTMGLRVMVGDVVQISDLWGQFFANEDAESDRSYVTLDGDAAAEDDRVSFDGNQVLIKKAGRYMLRFKTSPEEKNSEAFSCVLFTPGFQPDDVMIVSADELKKEEDKANITEAGEVTEEPAAEEEPEEKAAAEEEPVEEIEEKPEKEAEEGLEEEVEVGLEEEAEEEPEEEAEEGA